MKDAKQPEPAENAEQKAPPPKPFGGKLKFILIGVVLILILAGAGAGAYFTFFRAGTESTTHEAEAAVEPVIQEMETYLVNLSDPGGKRFLKLTMKAKLDAKQTAAEFVMRNFEIRDLVLMLLSGKEFADIARPEDKLILKQELLAALNRTLRKGQVQDLYFTEFLVQ